MSDLTASDRVALIRLASSLPAGSDERRAILASLGLKASAHVAKLVFVKQDLVLPLSNGTSKTVEAAVAGPWAVHKNVAGSGWAVTFAPEGMAVTRNSRSMADAKAFIEAMLTAEPELMRANDKNDVLRHTGVIRGLLENPPTTGKKPHTPSVADLRNQVRKQILDAGLVSVGERYGKAGEFFYPKLNSAPNRSIALGNRDVLLNEINARYEQWRLFDSELISKITPEKIARWVEWVKAGGTRIESRR